jgi:hypothetical protein
MRSQAGGFDARRVAVRGALITQCGAGALFEKKCRACQALTCHLRPSLLAFVLRSLLVLRALHIRRRAFSMARIGGFFVVLSPINDDSYCVRVG